MVYLILVHQLIFGVLSALVIISKDHHAQMRSIPLQSIHLSVRLRLIYLQVEILLLVLLKRMMVFCHYALVLAWMGSRLAYLYHASPQHFCRLSTRTKLIS